MLSSFITLFTLATATIAAPVADLVLPPQLEERDGPNVNEVYIRNITYGGSGCPQGSVAQFLSDTRDTFTLLFDSFTASIGPNTKPSDSRKACQINIDLHYPQGFQYSVLKTTFRGYIDIERGITARQNALYYFSGPNSAQVSTSKTWTGPRTENYRIDSAVAFTSTVWSPCGASWPLNLNSQVSLVGRGSGQIVDDTVDGNVRFVTGVQWRRC